MASGDARPIPIKGQPYRLYFPILDADGDPVASASTLTSRVSKDGNTIANGPVPQAIGEGMYYIDLGGTSTTGEMDANAVFVIINTATGGAKAPTIVLYPQEPGDIRVDVQTIATDTTTSDASAANLAKTTAAIARGRCTGASNTTSIVTDQFSPAGVASNQFKGRIVTFDANTTTSALKGQSTDITLSSASATPTLTVTALTTAPVAGDTFSVT